MVDVLTAARDRTRVRVHCTVCPWAGGRAVPTALDLPCGKCGEPVRFDGDPYVERRMLAGCPDCQWWGLRYEQFLASPCPHCEGGPTITLGLVDSNGERFCPAALS
jgi:hypothetical protein